MGFQDLVIQKLKNDIVEQLEDHIKDDLDLIVFKTRINDKGQMQLVSTIATNTKGERQKVLLGKKLKTKQFQKKKTKQNS